MIGAETLMIVEDTEEIGCPSTTITGTLTQSTHAIQTKSGPTRAIRIISAILTPNFVWHKEEE